MCTVLINDNNCPQSQHTSKWIMKLPGKYLEDIILMVSIALLKWFIFAKVWIHKRVSALRNQPYYSAKSTLICTIMRWWQFQRVLLNNEHQDEKHIRRLANWPYNLIIENFFSWHRTLFQAHFKPYKAFIWFSISKIELMRKNLWLKTGFEDFSKYNLHIWPRNVVQGHCKPFT